MKILAILCLAAVAKAAPPACITQFQYNCAVATLGGYTVITPLAGTGETQIEGFNTSNAVVFNLTLPIPPSGSAASDTPTQQAVLQADALLAVQSGQASTLPACSSASPPCIAPDPGGSTVITNSTTSSYVAQDTTVSQQVNQYATTLKATVNGQTVFQQTYAAAFSDPAVQAAVSAADAILTADHATPGSPIQTSSSSVLQGSQSSYVLTGDTTATGTPTVTDTETFGPAAIPVGANQSEVFLVLAGQKDINVNTNTDYFADRNVVTTDTYLTTQTYTIQGTGGVAYSACDINRDGVTNVLDVQDILGQASGASPPGASDLNGDGVVNVVDIQFVIDASLNLGCAAVNTGTSTTSVAAITLLRVMGDIVKVAGIAVDAAGNLYIADSGRHRIRKLSANGALSTVADNLDPAGIALDAAGDLHIADSGNHRILRLSAAGTLSTVSESFDHPTGIAVDSKGNLYIADNHRVLKMTPSGTRSTVAENLEPTGIAVDREGYLYILDSANHRVFKLAPNGTISTVAVDGSYSVLAVDAAGNLHFADEYNQLIRKLRHP